MKAVTFRNCTVHCCSQRSGNFKHWEIISSFSLDSTQKFRFGCSASSGFPQTDSQPNKIKLRQESELVGVLPGFHYLLRRVTCKHNQQNSKIQKITSLKLNAITKMRPQLGNMHKQTRNRSRMKNNQYQETNSTYYQVQR